MRVMLPTGVFILCALCAAPAQAQTPDARWSRWLGCWELVTTDASQGASLGAGVAQPSDDAPPRICVTPAGNGARFATTVPGQPAIAYTIVPDGSGRPVDDADCRGTQRSEWSRDGHRLFGRAQLTCSADRVPRQVSNLALLAPNGEWVDVQTVAVDGRESLRVRRYRRAATGAVSIQPSVPMRLDLDDVKEAATKVSQLALEATLVEANAGFNLTSKALFDLAGSGVGERVLDLMIALSFPDRFVVEPGSRAAMSVSKIDRPSALGWAYGHASWYDDFTFWPYYDLDFGVGRPILSEGGGGGGTGSPRPPASQPAGAARVVDGQGYTRVRPREPETAVSRPDGSVNAPMTASTSGGESSSSSSSSSGSSGSSSGSTATPSGFTSGGSGDSGRTAVPR